MKDYDDNANNDNASRYGSSYGKNSLFDEFFIINKISSDNRNA